MLLYYWRGCVQGPEYTSKYGNLPKYSQKMLSTNFFIYSSFFSYFLWISFPVSIFRYGPWTQPSTLWQQIISFVFFGWISSHYLIILQHVSIFRYQPWTLNTASPLQGNIEQYFYFILFFSDFLAISFWFYSYCSV